MMVLPKGQAAYLGQLRGHMDAGAVGAGLLDGWRAGGDVDLEEMLFIKHARPFYKGSRPPGRDFRVERIGNR